MRIEHIALYARDIEGAKEFFERYFRAEASDVYHNKTTGFTSIFLSFADGARLELMNRPELAVGRGSAPRTGYHHLAFSVGSEGEVERLTARLARDGFAILSEPRVTGDGYYESVVVGFEGNIIELTV